MKRFIAQHTFRTGLNAAQSVPELGANRFGASEEPLFTYLTATA